MYVWIGSYVCAYYTTSGVLEHKYRVSLLVRLHKATILLHVFYLKKLLFPYFITTKVVSVYITVDH